MIVGHRWEYSDDMRWYECVGLPFGGVESHQWCVGCGCRITDKEIYEAGFVTNDFRDIHLDMLARGKGYEPIEVGTIEEWKLRKRQGVLAK